ncbi:MAG: polysaccharide deacetylase family protein [Candidatus Cloacimonetes bacterium]|nr:polysaccharide deacetylase family protein [Candidatus Cloacimonadota bacterium]
MDEYIHISVDFDWIPGSDIPISRLYEMFAQYKVKATLFFTGAFAATYSHLLKQATQGGHEIGCHGLNHGIDINENYGTDVAYDTQKELIRTSGDILAQITGEPILCFRAPYLKVCDTTLKVLADLGYRIDSSLPARRFDFGCGSINSINQFNISCHPHVITVGQHRLVEIPPSACVVPLNMRMLRTFPFFICRSFIRLLAASHNPLVFYMHPAELAHNKDVTIPEGAYMGFYRNCGPLHFQTLERFLKYLRHRGIRSENMAHTYFKTVDLAPRVCIA